MQRHRPGQELPPHPWIPPRVGTRVGVGVAALVAQRARCPPQCQLLCGGSVAAPEGQDVGLRTGSVRCRSGCSRMFCQGCVPEPRGLEVTGGAAVGGRAVPRANSRVWSSEIPFSLSARAVLKVKLVGYGKCVVSPVSPMSYCPPSLSPQIAWGLPSSTRRSKQT